MDRGPGKVTTVDEEMKGGGLRLKAGELRYQGWPGTKWGFHEGRAAVGKRQGT